MFSSGSVASELIMSGISSTRPPMLMAITMSTIMRLTLFSIVSCLIAGLLYAGSKTATGLTLPSLTVFQTL